MHPDEAEDLELDDGNLLHLGEHGVSGTEVWQVWRNDPVWVRNRSGHNAIWVMVGRTDGGRPLYVPVEVDEVRSRLRPTSGRTCESHEVARWLN